MVKGQKYHILYKTVCLITNRFYIGIHSTFNLDDGYIGSGKRLWMSINKYGRENHFREILEYLSDRISLKAKEKEIVNEEMLNNSMCMNLQPGGEGGFCNKEHNLKCSSAGGAAYKKLRDTNPEEKKKHNDRSSHNIKKAHKNGKFKYDNFLGKTHTRESKDKIGKSNSISLKGERNYNFGRIWITHIEFGNKSINKDDLEIYLKLNWKKGRKMKLKI